METLTLRILEREYSMSCPADEKEHLLKAAQFLDTRLRDIRSSGRVVGVERIAVMSALNLASELMRSEHEKTQYVQDMNRRLQHLKEKIDNSLDNEKS